MTRRIALDVDFSASEWNQQAGSRHQGRVIVLFCEGHVESITLRALYRETSDVALARWNRDHLPHREQLGP
jgi:prepilin-type processing-associated H-X9-DG protein